MNARLIALGLLLVSLAPGLAAHADAPAPDECTMPGQPCTNTDSNRGDVGKRGICMPDTCLRLGLDDAGERKPIEYDCHRCKETGKDSGTGSGGSGGDDDCSAAGGGGSSLAVIALALAGLAARRRRRS